MEFLENILSGDVLESSEMEVQSVSLIEDVIPKVSNVIDDVMIDSLTSVINLDEFDLPVEIREKINEILQKEQVTVEELKTVFVDNEQVIEKVKTILQSPEFESRIQEKIYSKYEHVLNISNMDNLTPEVSQLIENNITNVFKSTLNDIISKYITQRSDNYFNFNDESYIEDISITDEYSTVIEQINNSIMNMYPSLDANLTENEALIKENINTIFKNVFVPEDLDSGGGDVPSDSSISDLNNTEFVQKLYKDEIFQQQGDSNIENIVQELKSLEFVDMSMDESMVQNINNNYIDDSVVNRIESSKLIDRLIATDPNVIFSDGDRNVINNINNNEISNAVEGDKVTIQESDVYNLGGDMKDVSEVTNMITEKINNITNEIVNINEIVEQVKETQTIVKEPKKEEDKMEVNLPDTDTEMKTSQPDKDSGGDEIMEITPHPRYVRSVPEFPLVGSEK